MLSNDLSRAELILLRKAIRALLREIESRLKILEERDNPPSRSLSGNGGIESKEEAGVICVPPKI